MESTNLDKEIEKIEGMEDETYGTSKLGLQLLTKFVFIIYRGDQWILEDDLQDEQWAGWISSSHAIAVGPIRSHR